MIREQDELPSDFCLIGLKEKEEAAYHFNINLVHNIWKILKNFHLTAEEYVFKFLGVIEWLSKAFHG